MSVVVVCGMVWYAAVMQVKWRRKSLRWLVGWDWGRREEAGWSFVAWELECGAVEWGCVG